MNVQRRKIGDREVYPVGLGCMNICHAYGPPLPEDEARALLVKAFDLGYDFFDTATLYGFGRSEELIGEALGAHRQDLFLASKCVLGFRDGKRILDGRPEVIKAACEASLKRLKTDVIDLYYLHRPDPNVPIEDSVGALADLVSEGKIRFAGLSEMGAEQLRRGAAVHPITAMQSEYSLWVRNPEIAVMQACEELGTALVAFSPVGRGFLADPPADPATFHETDMRLSIFPRFKAENYAGNLPLLDAAKAMAEEVGCSVAELAIAWTLAKGPNVLPIPGTTNLKHLEENFRAAEVTLTSDQVARLDAHFAPERAVGPRYNAMGQASVTTEMYDFERADG
ncbi:aldo/keto reductase [Hyphomonas jannaschiana]|uniref:Aldo/keto reductase family oxidoreductase n=1 Tax=Hyphomonas jannaschiana VP2 TaxID=1280952 RepID=A0A059FHR1_9PROT|nr:aldo/keto reductase [Hyphomonas jannaschiana]KCZ90189.1 aldo/keto reductase family oxidoreductase [Hyphomonas jannaschiana VP2]